MICNSKQLITAAQYLAASAKQIQDQQSSASTSVALLYHCIYDNVILTKGGNLFWYELDAADLIKCITGRSRPLHYADGDE